MLKVAKLIYLKNYSCGICCQYRKMYKELRTKHHHVLIS